MDDSEVFEDKVLTCVECGQEYTFEKGEQYFYKSKGLFEPRRCPECRARKRAHLNPSQGVRDDR